MALESGLTERISSLEPLEHSVLNVNLDNSIAEVHDEPMFGSDSGRSFMKFTDAMREDALKIRAAVPFPAGGVGRVALSPAEECMGDRDMCDNDISSEGFQCWNTDQDILNQYETFNGLPVYYGGDAYDSEDSERDDPFALAIVAYVEDYNFDVPEGMDLVVHRRSRSSDGSGTQRDDQVDMVPVCQMVSCVTRNGPDTFSDASGTETAAVDGQDMDDFHQWAVSSDEEDFVISDVGSIADVSWNMSEEELINSDVESVVDFDSNNSEVDFCCDSDVGSVADLEWNTWDDACALDFQDASGAFPPDPAVVRPAVKYSDILICEEECDNTTMDKRIARISPSANRHFGQTSSEYVGGDTYYVRLCLLHPAGVENLLERRDGYDDNQGLNHWHTVSWDPGVADSLGLSVCYDCLCLIALFKDYDVFAS